MTLRQALRGSWEFGNIGHSVVKRLMGGLSTLFLRQRKDDLRERWEDYPPYFVHGRQSGKTMLTWLTYYGPGGPLEKEYWKYLSEDTMSLISKLSLLQFAEWVEVMNYYTTPRRTSMDIKLVDEDSGGHISLSGYRVYLNGKGVRVEDDGGVFVDGRGYFNNCFDCSNSLSKTVEHLKDQIRGLEKDRDRLKRQAERYRASLDGLRSSADHWMEVAEERWRKNNDLARQVKDLEEECNRLKEQVSNWKATTDRLAEEGRCIIHGVTEGADYALKVDVRVWEEPAKEPEHEWVYGVHEWPYGTSRDNYVLSHNGYLHSASDKNVYLSIEEGLPDLLKAQRPDPRLLAFYKGVNTVPIFGVRKLTEKEWCQIAGHCPDLASRSESWPGYYAYYKGNPLSGSWASKSTDCIKRVLNKLQPAIPLDDLEVIK